MNHKYKMLTLPKGIVKNREGTLGDLLLVVDMQNAYLEGQVWACTSTSIVTDNIIKIIEARAVENVIFTRYIAPKNPVGTWIEYNKQYKEINENIWLNELVERLKPYVEYYPCYDKSVYSSYGNEEVARLCSMADRVIIAGVMAECCVLATIQDGIDAGDKIVYLMDACSGGSKEYEEITKKIVEYHSPRCTELMTTSQFIESKKF
ncbi:MAG: cysteine hydrolase [Cellulosilyticum sp.]|nr:cysteine hydrolase [Cellulosilyticum sp.]